MGGDDPLIDDFEGEGIEIPMRDGREGFWLPSPDETNGEWMPNPYEHTSEDAYEGERATHLYGGGFTSWGIGLALILNGEGTEYCQYDASAYDGLSFWARGVGDIFVHFSTRQTVIVEQGGDCAAAMGCYDDYGQTITLTDSWQYYEMTWDELERMGWGLATDFDPAELFFVTWQDPEGDSVDLWIDDVRFLVVEDEGSTGGTEGGGSSDGGSSEGDASTSGIAEGSSSGGTSGGSSSDSVGGSTGGSTGAGFDGSTGGAASGSDDGSSSGD